MSLKQYTIKKPFSNTITFHLEDENHEENKFNGEKLTFALHLIKNWNTTWTFKNLKLIVIALDYAGTKNNVGAITFIEKTGNVIKIF